MLGNDLFQRSGRMHGTHSEIRRCLGSGILAGVLLGGGMPGLAQAAAVHVRQQLHATHVAPGAQGQAVLRINRRAHAALRVDARNLGREDTFDVSVGGVRIGTLTTNAAGNGRARFDTQPVGHDQLLGTDPRGKQVTVSDHAGEDQLTGDIPDASLDPTAVRCCLADGDHTECDAIQAAECQSRGGLNMGTGSCLPNPCAGSGLPTDLVRCCRPGSEHPECEEVTPGDCSAAGGTNIGAGACDPDPCVPAASDAVRCCVAGDRTIDCEHLTGDHCSAAGGQSAGPGVCDPNPCASSAGGAFVGSRASGR
jgi:hypothetical protein